MVENDGNDLCLELVVRRTRWLRMNIRALLIGIHRHGWESCGVDLMSQKPKSFTRANKCQSRTHHSREFQQMELKSRGAFSFDVCQHFLGTLRAEPFK